MSYVFFTSKVKRRVVPEFVLHDFGEAEGVAEAGDEHADGGVHREPAEHRPLHHHINHIFSSPLLIKQTEDNLNR